MASMDQETDEKIKCIFGKLYETQPSPALTQYFEALKTPRQLDEETFISGIRCLADIAGQNRTQYYSQPLLGLRYPHEVEKLWRQTYPHLSDATQEDSFGWICPPDWSLELVNSSYNLVYHGTAPKSQGLNRLVAGPTSLDCGMYCQLLLWSGMRYMLGDEEFDRAFSAIRLKLVQGWNKSGPEGNPLFPFYLGVKSPRIRTWTIYNHSSYQAKHPGGSARLQNVTEIDGGCILFDPSSACEPLSHNGVGAKLVKAFNIERDEVDHKTMRLWTRFPNFVHPSLAPKSWGEWYQKALESQDLRINIDDLERDQQGRSPNCMNFNVERLLSCLKTTLKCDTPPSILEMAREACAKTCRENLVILTKDRDELLGYIEELNGLLGSTLSIFDETETLAARVRFFDGQIQVVHKTLRHLELSSETDNKDEMESS